jgi:hypothetical protein
MTDTRCWITYDKDRALTNKVDEGWFTEDGIKYLPIDDFPPALNSLYWPNILSSWCKQNGIEFEDIDELTISARVNKQQIEQFIQHVYGNSPSYNDPGQMSTWKGRAYLAHRLVDIQALVAQELKSNIWYELKADEF